MNSNIISLSVEVLVVKKREKNQYDEKALIER
jgi:hypothetical protein